MKPAVTDLPISGNSVTDLHLRPLFTTTIRLPEAVTSVAVGAPTLFEVEHSDQEPRLVFVNAGRSDREVQKFSQALSFFLRQRLVGDRTRHIHGALGKIDAAPLERK